MSDLPMLLIGLPCALVLLWDMRAGLGILARRAIRGTRLGASLRLGKARYWPRVDLPRPLDVAEILAAGSWLDARCHVIPGNETLPYRKSADWFAEVDGEFRVWRIRDPAIAQQFREAWA